MLAIGILLVLIGIPSMLFLFVYTIYAFVKQRLDWKKQQTYFADCEKAVEDAKHDKYGQIIMPDWFKEKYPEGIFGVWGIKQ